MSNGPWKKNIFAGGSVAGIAVLGRGESGRSMCDFAAGSRVILLLANANEIGVKSGELARRYTTCCDFVCVNHKKALTFAFRLFTVATKKGGDITMAKKAAKKTTKKTTKKAVKKAVKKAAPKKK